MKNNYFEHWYKSFLNEFNIIQQTCNKTFFIYFFLFSGLHTHCKFKSILLSMTGRKRCKNICKMAEINIVKEHQCLLEKCIEKRGSQMCVTLREYKCPLFCVWMSPLSLKQAFIPKWIFHISLTRCYVIRGDILDAFCDEYHVLLTFWARFLLLTYPDILIILTYYE